MGSDGEMILSSSGASCSIFLAAWARTPRTPPAMARPPTAIAVLKMCRREIPFCACMVTPSGLGGMWEILPLVGLRNHRVEGHPQHRSLGLVPPLVVHIRGHQHPVPFRHGIALPLAHQGPRPLQHVDHMVPAMGVTASVGVADRAWGHGPVVQHDIGGNAVFATEEHVPDSHVEIPVVAYDGRLTRSLAPLVAGAAALRRDERVDLDAPDHPAAAIVQGVMVHVPG